MKLNEALTEIRKAGNFLRALKKVEDAAEVVFTQHAKSDGLLNEIQALVEERTELEKSVKELKHNVASLRKSAAEEHAKIKNSISEATRLAQEEVERVRNTTLAHKEALEFELKKAKEKHEKELKLLAEERGVIKSINEVAKEEMRKLKDRLGV